MIDNFETTDPFNSEYVELKINNSGGDYTKFEIGDTEILILSNAISGYEYWTKPDADNKYGKPVRFKPKDTIDISQLASFKSDKGKIFFSMVVFNFNANKIQIFNTTIKAIKDGLKAISLNKRLKRPQDYIITITKTVGNPNDAKNTTTYSLMQTVEQEIPLAVAQVYDELALDLNLLYEGKDPFDNKNNPIIILE
jgi:hypothetical protein